MKILFLLSLSLTLAFSNTNYPELFSQLGTPLYKADSSFQRLPKNQQYSFDVKQYHQKQEEALKIYKDGNKPLYFKTLRSLSKNYEKIINALKQDLHNAIKNDDYAYFLALSNAGIKDLYNQESFKEKNYKYYLKNKNKGNSNFLDKSIQSEKEYEHLYGVDISSSSYSSSTSKSHHKRPPKVILLSRPGCGYCVKAKKFMNERGISYTEYNIKTSSKGKSLFNKYQGSGVPLIIIGDVVIRGYSQDAILSAL